MVGWDGSTPRRRVLAVVGAGVVLSAAIGVLAVTLFGGYPPPCEDDLAFSGPQVAFEITYDEATSGIIVRHRTGDSLRSESTEALFVMVEARDSDARTEYTLANSADTFPITTGDQLLVNNVTVAGRSILAGDEIRLIRWGSQQPLPAYCPTSRSESTLNHTVGKHVVQ